MKKKGQFLPSLVGAEIHYALIGIVIGIVLTIVLLVLARTGVIPLNLCKLVCG